MSESQVYSASYRYTRIKSPVDSLTWSRLVNSDLILYFRLTRHCTTGFEIFDVIFVWCFKWNSQPSEQCPFLLKKKGKSVGIQEIDSGNA